MKVQLLLSKFRLLNFDLLYFWYHLRCRVIQYLIRKLSEMVKMGQEGLVVAALLGLVRISWKVTIYNINRALLKLTRYALQAMTKQLKEDIFSVYMMIKGNHSNIQNGSIATYFSSILLKLCRRWTWYEESEDLHG